MKVYLLKREYSPCTKCFVGEEYISAWETPEAVIDAEPDGTWTEHKAEFSAIRYWTKEGWCLEEWEVTP